MKNLTKSILAAILFMVTFTAVTQAQVVEINERTSLSLNRKIELSNDSMDKQIKVSVNEKDCRFRLSVKSNLSNGKVTLGIFDPRGKQHGNYTIECQSYYVSDNENTKSGKDTSNDLVSGVTSKLFENAMVGDWIVKITPVKATGMVNITYSLDSKNK